MRDCTPAARCLAAAVCAVLAVSCAQEPYPLAPDTTDYEWRTLYHIDSDPPMLFTIWAEAADDIYAGGDGGGVIHYDGAAWSDVPVPATNRSPYSQVHEIVGDGAGGIYIATSYGTFCNVGGSWEDIGERSKALHVLAPDDVLALQSRKLARFDGSTWMTLADPVAETEPTALWASSASDIYVVRGNQILHYDGSGVNTAWTSEAGSIVDIWGDDQGNVVGSLNPIQVMHFDGTAWTDRFSNIWGGYNQIYFAWGNSVDDLWMAASTGYARHYDGELLPRQYPPFQVHIRDAHGNEDVGTVTCGSYGMVMRHDGQSWEILRGREPVRINAAAPMPDGSIVVAYDWTGGYSRMTRFAGGEWEELDPLRTPAAIAIWGDLEDLYAATDNGEVFYFHDLELADWTGFFGPDWLDDVAVDPAGRVVACGAGLWELNDESRWQVVDGIDLPLSAVDARDGAVIAVGERGEVLTGHDGEWTQTIVDSRVAFHDVWMASPDFAIALGQHRDSQAHLVYQFDGTTWTQSAMGRNWTAGRVVGRSRDDVFITGVNSLYHFDGEYWSESPSGPYLAGLVCANDRIIGWAPHTLVEIDGR